MRRKLLTAAVSALAVGALATAVPADAAPNQEGNYGVYANEGKYPEQTGAKFRLVARRAATHNGRRVTLKVFYNGRVGAFARIDNAPRDCVVVMDRTPGTQEITGIIRESVDPGISFAYTKIANNLEGRLARGALICGDAGPGQGFVLARTKFF
jgi:hypothetical protein